MSEHLGDVDLEKQWKEPLKFNFLILLIIMYNNTIELYHWIIATGLFSSDFKRLLVEAIHFNPLLSLETAQPESLKRMGT